MKASCAVCRNDIRGRKKHGSRTQHATRRRFPELCGVCLREVVVESVRVQEGFKSLDEVAFSYRGYVQRFMPG